MLRDGWQETYGQPHLAFFYVELVCNIWFIIELAVRLVVSLRSARGNTDTLTPVPPSHYSLAGFTEFVPIYQVAGEHNRLNRHVKLLHRRCPTDGRTAGPAGGVLNHSNT